MSARRLWTVLLPAAALFIVGVVLFAMLTDALWGMGETGQLIGFLGGGVIGFAVWLFVLHGWYGWGSDR